MNETKEQLTEIIDTDAHHDMHFSSKEAEMFNYIQILAKAILELIDDDDEIPDDRPDAW